MHKTKGDPKKALPRLQKAAACGCLLITNSSEIRRKRSLSRSCGHPGHAGIQAMHLQVPRLDMDRPLERTSTTKLVFLKASCINL